MKELYTISEIADFFNVSRQTLIYYDNINVFKPFFVDEKNGYRYYSRDQFSEFSFLLLLKNTGFSLKDIKLYFKSTDLNESKSFLEEKLLEINRRIEELKMSKEGIENKLRHIERVLKNKKNYPVIKEISDMKIIKVNLESPYDNLEFEKALVKLKNILKEELEEENNIFSSVLKENIVREYRGGANYIGKILDGDNCKIGEKIEGGRCVSIIHTGLYDDIYATYLKALEFIEKKRFEIRGDSIEFFSKFTLFLGSGAGGYMEILIPIK